MAKETNDKYPSHSMRAPPNYYIFPSQAYQYTTNLPIVKEHLTACFTKIVHLFLEYEDMQTQTQIGCKKEQIPQWEVTFCPQK